MKNIPTLLNAFASLILIFTTSCSTQTTTENLKPNIIYIFPDQFRNTAMGFWDDPEFKDANIQADPVHTPNINKFAKEALVSSTAISNCPLSSPHRGSLLTGTYPHKSGVPINCNSKRPISSLKQDLSCISDIFSQHGYECAYIGKWHLDHPTPNIHLVKGLYTNKNEVTWNTYTTKEYRHNFNFWYSYNTYDVHKDPHYWDNEGKLHKPEEWPPIHEAQTAIKYLQNKNEQRDASKPFFIMIGMNPPYGPYRSHKSCMEEDYNLYKDIPISHLFIHPNADTLKIKAQSAKFYFASVTGVDRAFGMIINELKNLDLERETIVVFSSDHGEMLYGHHTDEANNLPYMESTNVPFLIRYPGHIRPRLEPFMISSPDIMPTLLGLANLQNFIPESVQGYNYARFITESEFNTQDIPEQALYIQNTDGEKDSCGKTISYFPKGRGIKTKNYTLALFIDEKNQLKETLFFNDSIDYYQLNNLKFDKNKAEVKKLLSKMGKELSRIKDPWFEDNILSDLIPYSRY